jgi:acyl-CoA dehydrogenase
MGFELNDRVIGLNVQLQAFMDKHIYPREHDWHEWCLDQDNLWVTPPLV